MAWLKTAVSFQPRLRIGAGDSDAEQELGFF
jgi:hypothetical protein